MSFQSNEGSIGFIFHSTVFFCPSLKPAATFTLFHSFHQSKAIEPKINKNQKNTHLKASHTLPEYDFVLVTVEVIIKL
jgi:hypothetical protein